MAKGEGPGPTHSCTHSHQHWSSPPEAHQSHLSTILSKSQSAGQPACLPSQNDGEGDALIIVSCDSGDSKMTEVSRSELAQVEPAELTSVHTSGVMITSIIPSNDNISL
jgi:hypothetical protein